MDKLRVLVMSNMYPSERSQTFGIFVKNQVEQLKAHGVDVDVSAVADPRLGKVYNLRKYAAWGLKSIFRVAFKGRKYKVVHAHYVFPTGLIGLIYKKLYNTKLVVTAHGGDIDRMPLKSPLVKKLTQKILHEADAVIAVGDRLYHEIHVKYGVNEDKLHMINMGVDRTVFKPYEKAAVRNELGLAEEEKTILFVGNIIKQKGLLELAYALQMLVAQEDKAVLHLIGSLKNNMFYEQFKEKIHKLNLQDHVVIHGTMTQTDIAKWMSASQLLALPSHMEGFGLVAVEAMACHTPVVGSDVGGLSSLLSDGAGILIQPGDAESLYEGIFKVLTDSTLSQQLIHSGEQKASENDQSILIKKLIHLYENPTSESSVDNEIS